MKAYKNFNVAAYVYAYYLDKADESEIQRGIDYFNKYIPLSKVYLETHRATTDIPLEKMKRAIEVFKRNGIAVSGGITSTGTIGGNEKPSLFDTFCFSDPDYRKKYLDIVEYTASLFDEIILDDYFFTSCRCELCIENKGSRSWAQFRLELMEDISREIVALAKKVNPKCNFIIKYPNWYESYQETGYNPGKQKDIFDMIYAGTETRTAQYSQQHLQRYLSYSIIRLFENVAPNRNGGGWIDLGGSWDNMNRWLEQANLTMLARAKELMLFNFYTMIGSPELPPLGQELYRIDSILDKAGNPIGVSTYEPYDADGEDQVLNYIGMCGIPFEPKPYFDDDAPVLFLSETSACDPDIMKKLESYVRKGGNAIVTTGFLKETYGMGIKEMTSVRLTGRYVRGNEYMIDRYNATASACVKAADPASFEVLSYKTNATWSEVIMLSNEDSYPVMTEDRYGRGYLYILNLPQDFADLFKLPKEVWRMIAKRFAKGGKVFVGANPKYNLFAYDNDVYGIISYRPMREVTEIIIKGDDVKAIEDIETGEVIMKSHTLPGPSKRGDSATYEKEPSENVFSVAMMPGKMRFFRLVKK